MWLSWNTTLSNRGGRVTHMTLLIRTTPAWRPRHRERPGSENVPREGHGAREGSPSHGKTSVGLLSRKCSWCHGCAREEESTCVSPCTSQAKSNLAVPTTHVCETRGWVIHPKHPQEAHVDPQDCSGKERDGSEDSCPSLCRSFHFQFLLPLSLPSYLPFPLHPSSSPSLPSFPGHALSTCHVVGTGFGNCSSCPNAFDGSCVSVNTCVLRKQRSSWCVCTCIPQQPAPGCLGHSDGGMAWLRDRGHMLSCACGHLLLSAPRPQPGRRRLSH